MSFLLDTNFQASIFNDINSKSIDHLPKLSNSVITINSPKNITYTKPMRGYYPSTYGFESDADGTLPSYLTQIDPYPISVISSRNEHNKVLWFDDNGYSYRASCSNTFNSSISYGTIELWFLVDDAYDRTGLILRHVLNATVNMGSRYDKWKYQTATEIDLNIQKASGGDMDSPLDNVWHHIRIDFECTTNNYMGLDQFTWKCWIDGIESKSMPFCHNETYCDNFYMSTSWAHTSYNMYIDAIGYSWDSHYTIGDNLNEGLLLSFKSSINLDGMGYSLDNQINRTILGDTVFPFPINEGSHKIQIFGNDSFGTIYQSEIRYFKIKVINIITPENITYAEPMRGYYPATYGFENDQDGASRLEIDFIDAVSTYGTCEVLASYLDIENKEHKKILHVEDPSVGPGMHFRHFLDSAQIDGFVEFWFVMTDKWASVNDKILFYSMDNSNNVGFLLRFSANQFMDTQSNTAPMSYNTWYHIIIEFNCSSGINGQFNWYKNGILQYSNVEMNSSINEITQLSIRGHSSSRGEGYFDTFGFSWDHNYNKHDNVNEGILLSFVNGTNLDWIGYSLDEQANKSITGNIVFPFPLSEGQHTLQVFGNDSLGMVYQSDIRYFTIKYYPINIITPENRTYTAPMSGYYPATFGFENDSNGDNPTGWLSDEIGGSIQVFSELDGHKNVVEFYDSSSSEDVWIRRNITSQISGTLEVWVRISDTTESIIFEIFDTYKGNRAFQTQIRYNILRTSDYGSGWQTLIDPALDNTWYHIRWDFNCLDNDYDIYINNQLERINCNFSNSIATIGHVLIRTSNSPANYCAYIDAFAVVGESGYEVGDNLYEGLLLSYVNRTSLEWIGYTLNGQKNRTIKGDTVISISGNGIHNIKVYGKNSSGITVESPLRYFTIAISGPQISINTPASGENFGVWAPYFSISITTPILDSTWYTINNGSQIKFSELYGTIDQTEWNNAEPGYVLIRFGVNDSFGQTSYSEVAVFKNTGPPMPSPVDFLIIFIILLAIGLTVINFLILRQVGRSRRTREVIDIKIERFGGPQLSRCPFCQNEIKITHSYCTNCGSKLN